MPVSKGRMPIAWRVIGKENERGKGEGREIERRTPTRRPSRAQMFPEKDLSAFRSSDHEIRPVRQIRMSQSFISVMLNAPATYADA